MAKMPWPDPTGIVPGLKTKNLGHGFGGGLDPLHMLMTGPDVSAMVGTEQATQGGDQAGAAFQSRAKGDGTIGSNADSSGIDESMMANALASGAGFNTTQSMKDQLRMQVMNSILNNATARANAAYELQRAGLELKGVQNAESGQQAGFFGEDVSALTTPNSAGSSPLGSLGGGIFSGLGGGGTSSTSSPSAPGGTTSTGSSGTAGKVEGTIGGGVQGASLGSHFGPWGAAAGGLIGGVTSAFGYDPLQAGKSGGKSLPGGFGKPSTSSSPGTSPTGPTTSPGGGWWNSITGLFGSGSPTDSTGTSALSDYFSTDSLSSYVGSGADYSSFADFGGGY